MNPNFTLIPNTNNVIDSNRYIDIIDEEDYYLSEYETSLNESVNSNDQQRMVQHKLMINSTPTNYISDPNYDRKIGHLDESLDAFINTKFDLRNPQNIINTFEYLYDDVLNIEGAERVAKAFQQKFGSIIVYDYDDEFKTIMDYIMYYKNHEFIRHSFIVYAFIKSGFKFARECNPMVLFELYSFSKAFDINDFQIDYESIKQENAWIKEGLVEYFCQPRFIEKWLNDGNELEDYLV